MRYREDFITFMQNMADKYAITLYCIGGSDLPEIITMSMDYDISAINGVQIDYYRYLKETLGKESIYGEHHYAIDIDLIVPREYDYVFRRKEN